MIDGINGLILIDPKSECTKHKSLGLSCSVHVARVEGVGRGIYVEQREQSVLQRPDLMSSEEDQPGDCSDH